MTAKSDRRKRVLEMSAKPQRKADPGTVVRKDVFNAGGVLLEFLASPEEVRDSICGRLDGRSRRRHRGHTE